jgi:hypothetical protein
MGFEQTLHLEYRMNATPADQIEWYLRCPGARTAAFAITGSGLPIGTALCLMRDHPGGTRTGRIVHLSYLGEDAARWRGAVALLESWLADQGCAAVSAFASHPQLVRALADREFLTRGHPPSGFATTSTAYRAPGGT